MMSGNSGCRERLVVVGNGIAAMRTLEALVSRVPWRYEVTVIGAEPHPNYNRILLSSVLAGERTIGEIVTHAQAWYAEHGVRLHTGNPVTAIDRTANTVSIAGTGAAVPYDKLLLATGSKPLAPPIPGLDLPDVCAFRDLADTEAMISASKRHRRAIVIGGGLLGLEAAWGLRRRGMVVAVVHLMPTLMERQLDMVAGEMLRSSAAKVSKACSSLTGGRSPATWWSSRSASDRTSIWRPLPGSTSIAASWSATTCARATLKSMRSASALSITAKSSA